MHQNSVLRVFTTSMSPSFRVPWQMKRTVNSTGSAVYLGNNEILTGAHVVTDATFIQVQSLYSADKFVARIKSISHDADLALLELEEPAHLEEVPVATIGGLPELKSAVEVVGFPMGGEQVSITNGVLSRVEVSVYSHGWRPLLCATIDAAINPGNSGGPVFNEQGEVVGIAFQKDMEAENSGQMVPSPVLNNFLKEARAGRALVPFPMLGIAIQYLDNPALRAHFKMPEGEKGILVTDVDYQSTVWGHLQAGDILHQLDDYPISNLGTINYQGRYRTALSARLSELAEGDTVTLVYSRGGERYTKEVKLTTGKQLVPREQETLNRYCVFGGLVFQPLSRKFMMSWRRVFLAPTELRYQYELGRRGPELREVVVLSDVLSDKVNVGYDTFKDQVIAELNGVKLQDFAHFVTLLDEATEEVRLKTLQDEWIILSKKEVDARQAEILDRYRVPEARVL